MVERWKEKRKGRRWRREKERHAVEMVGVNEGWGDYCLIDYDEGQYKEPAHGR